MKSILHKAADADIVDLPFPHLVIHNALEDDFYEALASEFPPADLLLDGSELFSNRAYRYPASKILSDARISNLWREFTAYHVSADFYLEVISLFGDRIRSLHPKLETKLGKRVEDLDSSIRFQEAFRDIALESQFTYGAPVTRESRYVGPHIDREVALYAGLLYFRLEADDSTGGDLLFYRFKSSERAYAKIRRRVPERYVEVVKQIRYQQNTLVFFLHSPDSVHGVSTRSVTAFPRIHINFVGEFQDKVFDLSNYPEAFELLDQ
jgi:hypothetical protein